MRKELKKQSENKLLHNENLLWQTLYELVKIALEIKAQEEESN